MAVLGELDREAVVGALVHAGDVALDHHASLEVEALDAGQRAARLVAIGDVNAAAADLDQARRGVDGRLGPELAGFERDGDGARLARALLVLARQQARQAAEFKSEPVALAPLVHILGIGLLPDTLLMFFSVALMALTLRMAQSLLDMPGGVTSVEVTVQDIYAAETIAQRIAASGERVEDYLDIEFSVPESRFNNWPAALREQFEPARTVKPGKSSYDLAIDSED